MTSLRLAIIGDYDPSFRPHQATKEAIHHVTSDLHLEVKAEWIATDTIIANFEHIVHTYHGYWIAPGSPYRSMEGALKIIQHARVHHLPTLGTCGGFQHMVIEFSRHVMNLSDAEHAEYNPYASRLIINPLSCKLKGQKLDINLVDPLSKTAKAYSREIISERYYCNFGLNPEYQQALHTAGFSIVGIDATGEARIVEIKSHPFFIATLFVPQDNSSVEQPHPLILFFIKSMMTHVAGD